MIDATQITQTLVTQDGEKSKQDEQDDQEEKRIPQPHIPITEKRRNRVAKQNLREAQEYVGYPQDSVRQRKAPRCYSKYVALMSELIKVEPSNFQEASKNQLWKDAMVEEYSSIMKNSVWEVVPQLEDKSVVELRWLYKIKHVVDGSVEKFKAHFVAKGFSQEEGIDYDENFTLVARYSSIRAIIFVVAQMGWKIHQMDVKTTFLNGVIEEDIYVEQPEGFEAHGRDSYVCGLKRELYGFKQAPRTWYSHIDNYLESVGFIKSEAGSKLYYIQVKGELPILLLYVDDFFLTGSEELITHCKQNLAREFEMKDLGLMHYFLGLDLWKKVGEIFLGQEKYLIDILKKFGMDNCKPMSTPLVTNWKKIDASRLEEVDPSLYRQLIGSLMYLVNTRLDICFAVNSLSQFMVQHKYVHCIAAKNVWRYL